MAISAGENPSQQVAIWRPRAPPGYMILGDCATSGYEHDPFDGQCVVLHSVLI